MIRPGLVEPVLLMKRPPAGSDPTHLGRSVGVDGEIAHEGHGGGGGSWFRVKSEKRTGLDAVIMSSWGSPGIAR